MMRKLKLFVIASTTLVVLTACSGIDLDFLDGDFDFNLEEIIGLFLSDNDEQTETDKENEHEQNSEGTTEENDYDENEVEASSNPELEQIANNDIEKIFNNMAKAVKPVKSVSSISTIDSEDDEGNKSETVTKVKTILDPLVVHIEFEGDAQLMEMYADENEVFANLPGQGWVMSPDYHQYLQHVSQQINEDHILHFNNYLEHFEATSDDTHYIIKYIGPEEMYDEIFMNENLFEEVLGDLSGVLEGLGDLFDMTSSGEVTMKVWKHSFLMDEQIMETKSKTSIFGFEIETEERIVQKLTYDEVEPFTIPDEVKRSAKNLH